MHCSAAGVRPCAGHGLGGAGGAGSRRRRLADRSAPPLGVNRRSREPLNENSSDSATVACLTGCSQAAAAPAEAAPIITIITIIDIPAMMAAAQRLHRNSIRVPFMLCADKPGVPSTTLYKRRLLRGDLLSSMPSAQEAKVMPLRPRNPVVMASWPMSRMLSRLVQFFFFFFLFYSFYSTPVQIFRHFLIVN